MITIMGNGFITASTMVRIDAAWCNVIHVSLDKIVCNTTSHVSGNFKFIIQLRARTFNEADDEKISISCV